MGCCLLALILAGAPRVALIFYWFMDAPVFDGVFDNWFIPVLGFFLLPWLTLMYVIVAPGGITGFEWALIALGALLDLGSYGGGGGASRRRKNRD